ncbi:MAG: hypothetical protein UR96_C0002G0007 [candidate division WS6 bacterium GW2011_GWC1_36_11]|uniref:Uncharacterized protein n=3 Tax=Candidatus Dojkabacteria TaxID=74243 RepID=A0A0G0DHT8_9BACT|nr:MAG: hypothetical protein UR96_C0002G0007 [candidate division WS6 bacterium GW2011_GWC1_36_11]KKQ04426.1 MAG: hypothetical protein US14_C0011G0003 [candidate division WS6 bacterium GW2011_WS6_36_26]KKQ10819.1 MAG: hypothetical protein US23_C0022G0002 [candidate division WS6 bacterium GW2011_GWE1_36_69]KKQ11562.1 MAG: hypothetical protein US24_C0023G0008 [candidate division WS6 bacterium GW2011_GWC2_36_7]KKQ15766.1 MAG: hypothetical protein US29_C0037G0006 [candidate division WS6 bacterium GW
MKKETYSAQALAIAMVVLVVSSILAISIYSRVSKDKTLSLDERNSAEALEVSDLILNYLTAAPIDSTIETIEGTGQSLNDPTGITLTESASKTEISDLLDSFQGVTNSLDNLSICPLNVSDNTYSLNIRKADLDTYFEVRPGQIMALPIKNTPLGEDCNTTLKATVRGDSGAAFSITYIYAKGYNTEGFATYYKPYSEDDVLNYCFASSGICNNEATLGGGLNWVAFPDDNSTSLNIDLNDDTYVSDDYVLDEVKITAIGGTVGISYSIPTACTEELNMINIQAGANCSGTYRGKSVLIPKKQWEVPIFNYVLFNGEGTL